MKGANPVPSKLNRYLEAKPERKDPTQGLEQGCRRPPARVGPGGALPDSLRQLIAKFRAEGKELPDSLRQKLRALRGGGRSGGE